MFRKLGALFNGAEQPKVSIGAGFDLICFIEYQCSMKKYTQKVNHFFTLTQNRVVYTCSLFSRSVWQPCVISDF